MCLAVVKFAVPTERYLYLSLIMILYTVNVFPTKFILKKVNQVQQVRLVTLVSALLENREDTRTTHWLRSLVGVQLYVDGTSLGLFGNKDLRSHSILVRLRYGSD